MGLKDLILPTDTVDVPGGGSFAVRGLSMSDISSLLGVHARQLAELYNIFSQRLAGARVGEGGIEPASVDLSGIDFADILRQFVQEAPELVAAIIWTADPDGVGDADDLAVARRIPALVQIDALQRIGALTFRTVAGDRKNFAETVIALFQGTTGLLEDLRRLKTGSGQSGSV